jgi:hypothetical protein
MKIKSIPHKPYQSTPHTPPSVQLPKGVSPQLLTGLNELGQATSHLLAGWLGFHPEYVRQLLKRLETEGFVMVLYADNRSYQRVGSVPPIYTLSAKGRAYLRALGITVTKRFKETEVSANPHTIAVNHVLVNARLLQRENPSWVKFAGFRHESMFRQKPLKVRIPDGKTVHLKPDLWLDFQGVKSGRYCFCVEVNLTEVTESVWREKVRAYLYSLPAYRAMFGTGIIQVVVIVATRANFPKRETQYPNRLAARAVRAPQYDEREARMKFLKEATEKELIAQNAQHEADMFLFSYFALDRATPTQLFLERFFHMPFSKIPTAEALIQRKESVNG